MTDALVQPLAVPVIDRVEERRLRRIEISIAAGAFLASFAMNFWWPVLPFFLQEIRAMSDAQALGWLAFATSVQGVARLVTGPFWGVLSDRYGRKLMFVRSLYAATLTTIIAAVAHAPWVIVVALGMQGLLSGFIPAAIALTSVSVPDARIGRSLGVVTAGQYLGGTLGPMIGGNLAEVIGFRGAITVSAVLPALAATWIIFAVPRDTVSLRTKKKGDSAPAADTSNKESVWRFGRTFWVAVVLYFGLFALNQLIRTATPIALKDMVGSGAAARYAGWAFTAAGIGSVIAVFVFPMLIGTMSKRRQLILLAVCAAAAMPLLFVHYGPWFYIAGFMVFAIMNAAAMPATNALIAEAVKPSLRGTAFGLASSAQALAFIVGPTSAAAFAAHSLGASFAVSGVGFLLLAALVFFGVRERRSLVIAD